LRYLWAWCIFLALAYGAALSFHTVVAPSEGASLDKIISYRPWSSIRRFSPAPRSAPNKAIHGATKSRMALCPGFERSVHNKKTGCRAAASHRDHVGCSKGS
jgi:hypothetical protein